MKLFQRAQNSLFGEILDSLLAPALLLGLMSIGLTWLVARGVANAPYDRTLEHNVRTLAEEALHAQAQGIPLRLSATLRAVLRADPDDHVWLQVLDDEGHHLSGDTQIPSPTWGETPLLGVVYLSDTHISGLAVRLAQLRVPLSASPGAAPHLPGTEATPAPSWGTQSLFLEGLDGSLSPEDGGSPTHARVATEPHATHAPRSLVIQLAETRLKQATHTSDIIAGLLLPQFALLPLAVMLLWMALARGIKPLSVVEERLRERHPDDLSPIDDNAVPQEVVPLVTALNVLLDKLNDSVATQKRFLADAAHQLKTPLAGLRMQADLALREAADEQALKQSLKQIGRSSVRATHMVNQLLAMARAEGGTGRLSHHPCDMARLTIDAVQEMLPRAMEKGLDLGYDGAQPGTRGVTLQGNGALLHELLHNLLDNAIHYTPSSAAAPGVITARVLADPFGHILLLQVENSGPGIPKSERDLVFEPFYRVLGNEADGSGLGLPIAREIARQHGALLLLEDAYPGQPMPGTRFTVRFDTSEQ